MPTLFTRPNKTGQHDFLYLFMLTSFFFLLEISFFIQCNRDYLSDFSFVSSQLDIPITILPGIIFFILAQLAIHFIYCVVIWWLAKQLITCFNVSVDRQVYLSMSLWFLGILTVLSANQYYFPNSKFAALSSLFLINSFLNYSSMLLLMTLYGLVIFIALFTWMRHQRKLFLFAGCAVIASIYYFNKPIATSFRHSSQPNVIIVGVDSLRPDFLSFFGRDQATPFFDGFLQQSVVFSEALTPLARTFPSWISILTGKYPKQNGIRYNLASQTQLSLDDSLPAILKRHGYETMYATDETRFSNIDGTLGFDRIIAPPMGLNDFLIGTFNDFPLSNLLINSRLGQWLFPYSYANRAVFFAYEPNSFLQRLSPAISEAGTKPLFLTVHFCLSHYPYLWSSLAANKAPTVLQRYQASIQRVDQQLNDLFVMLKANHLLDHAIVVLLSDHGEALELPGDRITEKELFAPHRAIPQFYPPSLDGETLDESAGHGTDVLGLPQYHSLLAFRLYGMGSSKSGVISGIVTLLAIKPTILDLLGLNNSSDSLTKIINGRQNKTISSQPIFLESDFTPEAIRTVYPEVRKVVLEGVQLFHIDPVSTRLTVKPGMGEMIIRSKQFAVIKGEWMLALYPQNKQSRMPILINLNSGLWTNDLHSSLAKQARAPILLADLTQFYGREIAQ